MWVGGVEVPSELVNAHRDGRLVLFVGAGASRDAPSNHPDFEQLTRSIADRALYVLSDSDLTPDDGSTRRLLHPDVVLGRIKDGRVDVHRLVAEQLSDPASTHNALHRAIVHLASTAAHLRIVTTNFDRHLTSAIEARGVEADEYAAPALPVGNDFTGVVYLHGTLSRASDHLVVTDGDFGKAYLRDAWAARFLERMFAEFSVLFIGYSHGDVVMRYLARALGPNGHRYVLTDAPEARDWKDLGLRPIGYQVVGGSHHVLGQALARWAEIAGMGLLDHRQRITDLVDLPPSGIPEDTSYLEELISDPDRVRIFTEFARSTAWLDWASTQPAFKALLVRGAQPSEKGRALAAWFVESFVMEESHTKRALDIVSESGGHLGPEICREIGFHLHSRGAPRPEWLGAWLVMLLRDAPASETRWLDYALKDSTWPQDRAQVMLLFDHLTEPTAELAPSFGPGGPRIDVRLRGTLHWLQDTWTRILQPNLSEVAHDVLAMADRHLRRARHLQVSAHPGGSPFDALAFRRSAIEPHDQDRYAEPIGVLIDAARDGIETMLDASDPLAAGYLRSWAQADSDLLRRLAIHGWTHRRDVDSATKVELVVRSGWLFDHPVRHEVFRLIAEALPAASEDAVESLIDAVFEPEDEESEHRPYDRFNALVWMDRFRPDHPRLTAALAEAHAVDPSWQARAHPDLTHSMEGGFVPSRPPIPIETFHRQVQDDPSALLLVLKTTKAVDRWNDGSTWDDSLSLITSAVQAEPSDGHRLIDVDPQDTDVARAVINGWSRASLDGHAANEALRRITVLDHQALVRDLAHMLSSGGRSEGHPTEWAALSEARRLARELWRVIPDKEGVFGEIDWLTRAIEHPGGNLAEFWLHVIRHDWRADEEGWSGLTDEHLEAIETMLSGSPNESRTQMAEVVYVSRLHFLFAADADWATRNVMSLLGWTDPTGAHRAWSSFSSWGRWNDQMLDAGLMAHYLQAAIHLAEFDEEHRGSILDHLAGIALTSGCDPLEWLPGVIVDLSDEDRATFADKAGFILDDLPSEAVEHQWSRWMRKYWEDRSASIPTRLSIAEGSAMAGWIPFLTGSFESAAQLVISRPARFREHDDLLRHMERHVDESPDTCARVIGHLLRNTEQPWWGHYDLRNLMPRLRAGSDPVHIRDIVEQAMRLGFSKAADW